MRGFAMAIERGDMFEISERILTGDAFASERSRKRDDRTAVSRTKSGRAAFALVSASLSARSDVSCLGFAVVTLEDLERDALACLVCRVGEENVEPLQGMVRVLAIEGHRSEVAAAMLCGIQLVIANE